MYKIRTCKACGQKLNVRTKGKLLQIKNRCKHFEDKLITMKMLDDKTIPIKEYNDISNASRIFPRYCMMHKTKLSFLRILKRNVDLYYCSRCATVHRLMPKRYIKQWKKRTWNESWHVGDVRLIVKGD